LLEPTSAAATAQLATASPWLVVLIVGGVVIAAILTQRRLRPLDPR
jgi:hypothetical protein